METTYFGLFALITTYILLISLKNTTFLLLLSSNVGKVAEFWTLTKTQPAVVAVVGNYKEQSNNVHLIFSPLYPRPPAGDWVPNGELLSAGTTATIYYLYTGTDNTPEIFKTTLL